MISNRSIPPSTVLPELAYPDVSQAAEWLERVFGFAVRLRIANHRIQMRVGDGHLVLVEGQGGGDSVMIRVEDVDALHQRVLGEGAKVVMAPKVFPYGEKQMAVEDFIGRRWKFSESVADVDPANWGGELV